MKKKIISGIINKVFWGTINLIIFQFTISSVSANLDGDSTPIVLNAQYTFTDQELAKGFVKFNAGFKLPPIGTVYWRVHEPVAGQIDLQRGTLEMQSDLYLASGASIISRPNATIYGNDHTLFLDSDLTISTAISFQPLTADTRFHLDGRGHRLIFSAVGNSIIGFRMISTGPFTTYMNFSNVTILNAAGAEVGAFFNPLRNNDLTDFTFNNVTFVIPEVAGAELALFGPKKFQGLCRILGKNASFHLLNRSFTLGDGSILYIGPSMNFLFNCRSPRGISFEGPNSILYLDNCNLLRNFNALQGAWTFTNGRMIIQGAVNFLSSANEQPLVLGKGVLADDFDLEILPGSSFLVGQNTNPFAFTSTPTATIIYRNIF